MWRPRAVRRLGGNETIRVVRTVRQWSPAPPWPRRSVGPRPGRPPATAGPATEPAAGARRLLVACLAAARRTDEAKAVLVTIASQCAQLGSFRYLPDGGPHVAATLRPCTRTSRTGTGAPNGRRCRRTTWPGWLMPRQCTRSDLDRIDELLDHCAFWSRRDRRCLWYRQLKYTRRQSNSDTATDIAIRLSHRTST